MSHTEYHTGKFKLVSKSNENLEQTCKRLTEQEYPKLTKACPTWEEVLRDYYYEKYFIYNSVVYEIYDHKETEDNVFDLINNKDDTYSFNGSFYNGGADLIECIAWGLDEIKK